MSSKLTPMMQRYVDIKEQYKDAILFYRMGDFYEMFFDDALIVTKELGLTLTGKDCGLPERAPMCGVPFHAYESYASKLIAKGYKVAICEQLTPVVKGGLIERDVVRVITPGTVIDDGMVADKENSYIMSIYKQNDTISFAYADISTGEFCVGKNSTNAMSYLNDQIVCVTPAEIICNKQMKEACEQLPVVVRANCVKFNEYNDWTYGLENAKKEILEHYDLASISGYDFNDNDCIKAVGSLLAYLRDTQKRELRHLSLPRLIHDEQYMYLDNNTRRNLEIEERMKDGNKIGSLLWVLDNTNTSAGARLLRNWVNKPLQNIDDINYRLNIVEYFVNNSVLRADIANVLRKVGDIERIVARISYGTVAPKDFRALADSIRPALEVKNLLADCEFDALQKLGENIPDLLEVANHIDEVIVKDVPTVLKDGGYICNEFSGELQRLRQMSTHSADFIKDMEIREREKTGIKNLKISYNRVFGYFIEVNKQYNNLIPFDYVRKQTISNNERYITEELKQYEEEVLTARERELALENQIYERFKTEMLKFCAPLQKMASIVSKVDCLTSLASVASNNNYCKPTMSKDNLIEIKKGRHPVIEVLQKQNFFIDNDTFLNDSTDRTIILTGPNMAGKSTYMRQVALITLLAHIGSFVPAESAHICIVDRIFTRIGASDDLAVGQSTFMVEMVEVSNILSYATNKSLIILDEVGRGTSTNDGMSIASSVVEYLSKTLNCKTLFATHYHELMRLEGELDGVKNYCISIKEINGQLVFLRKIMRGSATRSYGIEVASLAGLPKPVIERAKQILKSLEGVGNGNNGNNPTSGAISNNNAIIDTLSKLDINTISPMVAFDMLSHLVDMVKE